MLRIRAYSTSKICEKTFESELQKIKARFHIVHPGDPFKLWQRTLSLVFMDGSFHFYQRLFPLLKKYQVKALLAIPTHYIQEMTIQPAQMRLAIPSTLMMQEGIFEQEASFCTWEELEEMTRSTYIEIAPLSHLYCNLTFPFVDLEREIDQPKTIIETRLRQRVTSFVYPFGKATKELHHRVRSQYEYGLCAGTKSFHSSWHNNHTPLTMRL